MDSALSRRGLVSYGQLAGAAVLALLTATPAAALVIGPFRPRAQFEKLATFKTEVAAVATYGHTLPGTSTHVLQVLVAEKSGAIHQFNSDGTRSELGSAASRPVDLAVFFSLDDNKRHVVLALSDGSLHDTYPNALAGGIDWKVATFQSPIVAMGAFYSPTDGRRHAIVALRDRSVHDVRFGVGASATDTVLTKYTTPIVGLGAFFTAGDGFGHAMVGLTDGTVHELYFHPAWGRGDATIARYPKRIRAISGYSSYFANLLPVSLDGSLQPPPPGIAELRHALVTLSDDTLHHIYFSSRASIADGDVSTLLSTPKGLTAVVGRDRSSFSLFVAATRDGSIWVAQ